MIRVVLFDLDDTLFAHRAAVEAGVRAHRAATGLPGDHDAEFARWNELEEHHYHRYLSGELGFLEQRRVRVRQFVGEHGVQLDDAGADDWYAQYLVEYRAAWSLHDDTLPCLTTLASRGVRLGIITNGERDFQTTKLDGTGIHDRFEHVVASGEVGVAKPDARIFHHACALFGVEPAEAAYVGDRLATDAIGAADAGLTGVWLARHGASEAQRLAAQAAGAHVIHSLGEVPRLVA